MTRRECRSTSVATWLWRPRRAGRPANDPAPHGRQPRPAAHGSRRIHDPGLALTCAPRRPRPTRHTSSTQKPQQLALQRAARLHKQRQVDRLVRHAQSLVVCEALLQPASDLLRRPAGLELLRHQHRQRPVAGELAPLRPPAPLPRTPLRHNRPLTATPATTVELTAHRRRRPPDPARDHPRRLASRNPTRDLLPLSQRQRQPATPPLPRQHTTTTTNLHVHRTPTPLQRTRDLPKRLTNPPPRPQPPPPLNQILPPPLATTTPPLQPPPDVATTA